MDGAVKPVADADELVKQVVECADAGYQKDRKNRENALKDLQMLSGDQWDAADRTLRESMGRPCLQINRLIQPVKQVSNDIRQSVPAVKCGPVDGEGDDATAAVFAGIVRQIQRASNATWVYAQAAGHAAACGIGHFRILTAYTSDTGFEQEVQVELIHHPLSVIWDPAALKPDRSDANWCIVFEFVPRRDWKSRFPNSVETEFNMPGTPNTGSFQWYSNDHVVVAEYWRKVPVTKKIGLLENGEIVDLTDVAEIPPEMKVVRTRDVKTVKLQQMLLSGSELLTEITDWPGTLIPIVPVIGNEIPLEQDKVRHGLVRFAIDSQRMHNYWRSSAAEWIQQGPKAPWLLTPEEIGEYKAMWDTANTTPRPYLLFNRDPNNPQAKPYREQPPVPPQSFWQEGQTTVDEIKATTGIYDASLGARSNEVSGRAISARQTQSDAANFEYTDNLRISLMYAGRVFVDLIPKIYDTQRIVRILDEEEREKFAAINVAVPTTAGDTKMLNDMGVGKYDLTISVGPSQGTRRLEAADSMMEFFKINPESFSIAGDLVVEAMDWPGKEKLAKRMRLAMDPALLQGEKDAPPMPEPDPATEAAKALELETMASKAELNRANAVKSLSAASREEVESMMKQLTGGRMTREGETL